MKLKGKQFFAGCATGMVLAVLLLVGLGLLLYYAKPLVQDQLAQKEQEKLKAPPIPMDAVVAYDWTLKGLDGEVLEMAALQGKPVFLSFWSPNCVACLAELPSLQILYEQSLGMVEFVTIVTKDVEDVQGAIDTWGVSFPIYTLEGDAPPSFDHENVPAAYILSAAGTMAFQHVGAVDWSDEKVLLFLERLSMHGSMESLDPAEQ